MLTKIISVQSLFETIQDFAQHLGFILKPEKSTLPDRAYIVSFYAANSHFLLAIQMDASWPLSCLKDGKTFDIDHLFISDNFGKKTIRQGSSSLPALMKRLGTRFDIDSDEKALVFREKKDTDNTSTQDYRVSHHGLLYTISKQTSLKEASSTLSFDEIPQQNAPQIMAMKKIGKHVGKEQCVGEIQTPLGTAACVLLENGSILMNLHLIFDIDQYNRQSQNSESDPLNLQNFFCDITEIKSFFVHNDTLSVHSFDHILCSGLSTLQHASRDIPENWDFAVLKPIGDVRTTLDIRGLEFSQWDHTGITNMLSPTHYIYAPVLNFETMTYQYHSDLYSPNAITPSIGNYMAILPDHIAERSSGSSGSIALQDGKLFLFNFQRGRLLPAVHLKYDISRAIQDTFNPLQYINLSWVDTGLLTLKSTDIKKYKTELSKEFNLKDLKNDYHFNQLIHNSNAGANNLAQFRFEFIYDCSTKSFPNSAPLTTQELYLTPYGWKARAEKKIPIDSPSLTGPLFLYRVIKLEELKTLAHDDTSVLHGHMGDYKQALCYLFRKGGGPRVLMEFRVNAKQLFSPENLALPCGNKPVSKALKLSLENEYSSNYDLSHGSEGTAKNNKFGIKEESNGESGFSLTFSSSNKHRTFKNILHDMQPVLWNKSDGKSQITAEGLSELWASLNVSPPLTNESII